MKRVLPLILICAMAAALLVGCTAAPATTTTTTTATATTTTTAATTTTTAETTTAAAADDSALSDLNSYYQDTMDAFLADAGENAPILLPETDISYLENFYPGISDITLKQSVFAMAPVTNAPNEVVLVEVADSADAQRVEQIFLDRVNANSQDSVYPENSAAWKNNARVTVRGSYVFLAVFMDPFTVPAQFILD